MSSNHYRPPRKVTTQRQRRRKPNKPTAAGPWALGLGLATLAQIAIVFISLIPNGSGGLLFHLPEVYLIYLSFTFWMWLIAAAIAVILAFCGPRANRSYAAGGAIATALAILPFVLYLINGGPKG